MMDLVAEDFQEFSLDPLERSVTSLKSAEEIEKHTVDERLTDIERSVYLLSSGQEVQRFSVIQNLPDLLKDSHAECMRRVVPKVREVLHVAQAEMQLAASSAFLQILQKQLVPLQNYTQTFLQTILNSVDNRDPEIANAWLDTLLDVIDLLPKDIIRRDVMNIAVAKGQLSQSIQSRIACCRILGKIATKFEPFVIKKDILPVVQSLCQDVEYEVRGCMCRQLDSVARGLGLEATKSAILPELVELTNDEESYVRLAGLETVVSILSLLDDETCISTIVPLVCKFCQQALVNKDTTLPMVAKQLGRLTHSLSVNLSEEQKHWFIDYYKKLCKIGLSDKNKNKEEANSSNKPPVFPNIPSDMYPEEEDHEVECRKNAAFNFPAMVLFTGSRYFKSELLSTFTLLCKDPCYSVRRTVSAGFHEVAKLLGNNAHLIQPELIVLLNDDCTEVLKGVVQHLPENLEMLSKTGHSSHAQDKSSLLELIPAIMGCESVLCSSNNWRLQADIMQNLACLPKCFSSDVIYQKFIPLIYRKMHTARALPVKQGAARTLLVLLRHIKRQEQRDEVFTDLLEEFCFGKSYHQRAIFIEVCLLVMELYSKLFFKSHYFEPLLELGLDPVPNIRLRLCPLLPKLKAQVKLPTDRSLLQQLETCVRKLLVNERDRDVTAAIQSAVEDMDRTQVAMESVSKLSHRMFNDEDLVDKKKEKSTDCDLR